MDEEWSLSLFLFSGYIYKHLKLFLKTLVEFSDETVHDCNFLQGRLLKYSFSYFNSYHTIEALLLLESECYNFIIFLFLKLSTSYKFSNLLVKGFLIISLKYLN